MPETNRILLILREWESQGLTLSIEDSKIRPSRQLEPDERELIITHRELIAKIIPTMRTFMSKVECQPHLKAWYKKSITEWKKKK